MKLQLYRPVTPFIINQNFGEDTACLNLSDRKTVLNREQGKSCPVGYDSLYKQSGMSFHNALDLKAYKWQPIYASLDGVVEELQTEPARGLGLGIVSLNRFEMNQFGTHYAKVRYWHLAAFNVKLGDIIRVGQLIGWADNTGYSSGDHLHFELKPVESTPDNKFFNVFQDNGIYGAIDPLQFIVGLSAFEINSAVSKIKYQVLDILNRWQDLLSKGR